MDLKAFFKENRKARKKNQELAQAWKNRDKTREAGTTSWLNPMDTHYSLSTPVQYDEYENPTELLADLEDGVDKRFSGFSNQPIQPIEEMPKHPLPSEDIGGLPSLMTGLKGAPTSNVKTALEYMKKGKK
jgi:hypothetical protein